MADVRVYFNALRHLSNDLGFFLGCDLPTTPKDMRVGDAGSLAGIAVLAKALTDNGILTDAQLQDAMTAARAEIWPDEPN
jgi:hypothetical protein